MPAVTVLSPEQILSTMKRRLQQANREFSKYPNATHWNVQQRLAFTYQQAFYMFNSSAHALEKKWNLMVALSRNPMGEWDDLVCMSTLGMNVQKALNEYAVNP